MVLCILSLVVLCVMECGAVNIGVYILYTLEEYMVYWFKLYCMVHGCVAGMKTKYSSLSLYYMHVKECVCLLYLVSKSVIFSGVINVNSKNVHRTNLVHMQ